MDRHAYYVVAPHYVRTSAGIKAMHILCHELNRIGERAFMIVWPFARRYAPTHPGFDTPLLTADLVRKDYERGLTPITVYPETIPGNIFGAPFVVRYVMNFPGLLGGTRRFAAGEMLLGYSRVLAEAAGVPDNVLFIPASDTEVFTPEPRVPRAGTCFFAGKYKYFLGGKLLPATANSTEITRDREDSQTPAQIADLFRRSEFFYCYENSALAIEAVLCECPVVFLPNRHFSRIIAEHELGRDGYAWGASAEELERARTTVVQGRANYLKSFDVFREQLRTFVAASQARAAATPYREPLKTERLNLPSYRHEALLLWRGARHIWVSQGPKVFFRKAVKRALRPIVGR